MRGASNEAPSVRSCRGAVENDRFGATRGTERSKTVVLGRATVQIDTKRTNELVGGVERVVLHRGTVSAAGAHP